MDVSNDLTEAEKDMEKEISRVIKQIRYDIANLDIKSVLVIGKIIHAYRESICG